MKFWAFWQKGVSYFWQSVDAILEHVSVAKTNGWCYIINWKTSIFQCSKNYGNPIRETNFKVAVNVANPNSLMKKTLVPLSSKTTTEPTLIVLPPSNMEGSMLSDINAESKTIVILTVNRCFCRSNYNGVFTYSYQ